MQEAKPPLVFWAVAGAGLLWNLMGCMNYIMQTNPDTVAGMPEVYQLIINARPAWATAGFACAVFGGAVGCILLLLRRVVAAWVLGLSLLGIAVTGVFTLRLVGAQPSLILSVLVGIALLWYATIAQRAGWLR